MKRWMAVMLVVAAVLAARGVRAEEKGEAAGVSAERAVRMSAIARLPVKEVTVFKDGHAFVLHEGKMPTDADGHVVMDYLPAPVMGTFWPYSAAPKAKLASVVAGRHRVLVERTALSVQELLEANVGAEITFEGYPARIVGIPTRSSEEREATGPPNSGGMLPQKGSIILIETHKGVRAVPISRFQDVAFTKPPKTALAHEEFRNLLTLKLDWGEGKPGRTAGVGLVYLQKGVRWIPKYRVAIDGKGKATVTLEATLLNEMTDLNDVTAHLVIGVPAFAFKDTLDPVGLGQTVAGLSQYFRQDARTAFAFSNAIMTQRARMREVRAAPAGRPAANLGPKMPGSDKSEDLFIFTVEHITLRKGERMVVPIAEYTLNYKDVYTLDVPLTPPPEVRRQFNNRQQAELAKLFHAPKVIHKIRLANKSKYPLTTAPALILSGGRLLGQGMMTYTAAGGTSDLAITTAVDVQVSTSNEVTKRTPNAAQWRGNSYGRFDLAGKISLTNHFGKAIDIEVTRSLLGNADSADRDGVIGRPNVFGSYFDHPHWWNWYSWPHWWGHFNGLNRVTWKLTLEPGKSMDLGYTWHYFWR